MGKRLLAWLGRFVVGVLIRLREGCPGLHAGAPVWAWVTLRLAASVGLLLCLAILSLVAPSVIEALRSPNPWTREGVVVFLAVAWVIRDALTCGRLAIG